MEYKYLGRTGLKVSELCMGSMNFGWTAPRENCAPVLDAFVEAGRQLHRHGRCLLALGGGQSRRGGRRIDRRRGCKPSSAIRSSSRRKCAARWAAAPTIRA